MNSNSDLRTVVMEGVSTMPKFLDLSYTYGVTNLLTFYPYDFLIVNIIWHFSFWEGFHLWM